MQIVRQTSDDPDNHLFADGLQYLSKFWYCTDDDLSYKRDMREREKAFQSETFLCRACQKNIPRVQTYWFQSAFYLDHHFIDLPERVKLGVACVPCLEKQIEDYTRTCVDCGMPFYLPVLASVTPFCHQCRAGHGDERVRINRHIQRAVEARLPATLTHGEWQQILRDFDNKCAYCQNNQYLALDHFIPLTHGGGTTASNCVPCCLYCNSSKGKWLPTHHFVGVPQLDIIRVQTYLATR